ncbi:uncharacterized protein LOC133084285 isoform X2 [Eubalaena glacialis]|uniref:uncharacterized protein LOC133084285 isoform X2 n=1 Tax=Eubalaena glacialis TaxID=27606 RepID=UPI002A5AEEEB|nr:uncharacterized protein LOC133084285 isoform X2 [Eubalaena glacialis]
MKGLGRLHTPGTKVWRGGEGQDGGAGSAGCLGLCWSMTAELQFALVLSPVENGNGCPIHTWPLLPRGSPTLMEMMSCGQQRGQDPREPHGSLLFHRLPSAGASRWSLLLCNTHTRLPWELLPDVTLALEAAEFRGSLLLLYLLSRTVPLEEGGFLRTLGGPFGPHQWKSSSICQPQPPILETAKRDIKKGADVRMCAGRGWGLLGPFMLRAFLSVWGRGHGFGQMLSFRSSPPISLHTPTRVSWVATQGPPTATCQLNREEPAPSGHSDEPIPSAIWAQNFHERPARGPRHGSLLVPFRVGFLSSQHSLLPGKRERGSEAAGKAPFCRQAHSLGNPQPSAPLDVRWDGASCHRS